MIMVKYNLHSVQKKRQGGFALISVIWTLALLSMLVMSFTLDAYLEGKVSSYIRARHQAAALIDSGLEIAQMLMERQEDVTGDETEEELAKDRWIAPAIRIKRGEPVTVTQKLYYDEDGHLQFDTSKVVEQSGLSEVDDDDDDDDAEVHQTSAFISIKIEPEPARWNINKLTQQEMGDNADEVWALILTQAGVPEEDHPELIDSFYDWVDEDSSPRSDLGAESDYYEREDTPYTAKNAPLDTIGELAYIRGFNRNNGVLLRGGIWNPDDPENSHIQVRGILDLFTTYGSGKINVNAASKSVLMTVPALEDVDGLVVDTVIEEREGFGLETGSESGTSSTDSLSGAAIEDYHFKDIADLTSRVPGLASGEADAYLTVDTGVFKIEIEGVIGRIKRRVVAVVEHNAKGSSNSNDKDSSLLILRWREEM